MKSLIATALLAAAVSTPVRATPAQDDITPERRRQVMQDVAALDFSSHVPSLLVLKCEKAFPDDLMRVRIGFMAWVNDHLGDVERIEALRTAFAPIAAATRNMTVAQADADSKARIDRTLIQRMFKDFSQADLQEVCTNLDKALPKMVPRERYQPAVQRLEALRPESRRDVTDARP